MACLLLYESSVKPLDREPSVWATIFLAIAAALALSFLLSGCASSDPEAVKGERRGTGDHSSMDRITLKAGKPVPTPYPIRAPSPI